MFSDENNSGDDISGEVSGAGDHRGKQTQPCSERQASQSPLIRRIQVDSYVWSELKGGKLGQGRKLQAGRGAKRLYRVRVV